MPSSATTHHSSREALDAPVWEMNAGEIFRRFTPAAIAYAVPFLLISYLALMSGGYDVVVRGEVGVAVWWLVLVGCATAFLPVARVPMEAWLVLAAFAGFSIWVSLGLTWTESAERTMDEVARVSMLLGVLALGTLMQDRASLKRTTAAAAAAITFVAVVALFSRFDPSGSQSGIGELLPSSAYRLSDPLGYWNGLSALLAMGVPLTLVMADRGKWVVARAAFAAAVPVLALAGYLTFSRGGAIEAAAALAALFALYPRRFSLAPTLAVTGVGSAILIYAASQRDALADGLTDNLAYSQGQELLLLTIVACGGVALVQAALALSRDHGIGPSWRMSRRASWIAAAVAVVVVVGAGLAGGAGKQASDGWSEFKSTGAAGTGSARFDSAKGSGRYQYWESAMDANATDRLAGIGPGSFEFWWSRHATVPGFVRDAHSLYAETLGEAGIVGMLLLGVVLFLPPGMAARRALTRGSPERRAFLAACAASMLAFCVSAAIDWSWEMTVLPVTLLLLIAAVLGPSAKARRGKLSRFRRPRFPIWARAGTVVVACGASIAILIPVASTSLVRQSQDEMLNGDPARALDLAVKASAAEPNAATPKLQEAMVLEAIDQPGAALVKSREATEAEPTNWRTWLVRSRVAAMSGRADESVRAYRRARALNPRSGIFR